MKIHYLQHVPFEGLGSIESWICERNHQLTVTRVYEDTDFPAIQGFEWLIILGGPMNIYEDEQYPWLKSERQFIKETIQAGKTVLGICLGAQFIADALGAKVFPNPHKEIGWFPIELTAEGRTSWLLREFPKKFQVFHWHGDTFPLPQRAIPLARSQACEQQAFLYQECVLALQFHLETTRHSAEQLIANCRNELVDAPFIQPAEIMLADDQKFTNINHFMRLLLTKLEQRT
ncbi:glutamine amidotransferase class-I [Candidatus Vecturithrix granuli]|uniref:Glutamine amidotransferase class-I n=1 Tax=Vecturithrix granuli TaxID=1499967 RepID=A0A081BYZ8_VECG1|nr:glutamine amidotransferase class-I [Candidatus Vecturithrix granuli]